MKEAKILINTEGCEDFFKPLKPRESLYDQEREAFNIKGLKSRRVQLIIEGKELLIEEIAIPGGKRGYIEQMVECALLERFHSLDEIAFDYKVISKGRKQWRVLVYCINLSNLILTEKENFHGVHIESIKVIQQIYGEAFRRALKKKEFYGLVVVRNNFYFFHVKGKILYENRVEEFEDIFEISDFIGSICRKKNHPKVIYLYEANPSKEMSEIISRINQVYIFNVFIKEREEKLLGFVRR